MTRHDHPFGPHNLPYGVADDGTGARVATRLGDAVIDLTALAEAVHGTESTARQAFRVATGRAPTCWQPGRNRPSTPSSTSAPRRGSAAARGCRPRSPTPTSATG